MASSKNKVAYNLPSISPRKSGHKFSLYSEKEKQKILDNFAKVVDAKFMNVSASTLTDASKGLFMRHSSPKDLYIELRKIHDDGDVPLVKDDSLTTWCNVATELYGLKVKDILNLKHNETLSVVLFDRNVGEYTNDTLKKGEKYDPLKGMMKGTYTHNKNLQGTLQFEDGDLLDNFEWELNLGAILDDGKWFWGPYSLGCGEGCMKCGGGCKRITKKQLQNIDQEILVGWRGPSILRSNVKKLPKTVTYHDTWYDDYVPYKYKDWLHKK